MILKFNFHNAIQWLNYAQYPKGYISKFGSLFRRIDIYPEITGYSISTYVNLHRKLGNQDYLSRARRAANALISVMHSNGAIPSIIHTNGAQKDTIYMFDQGIMADGLCSLAERLKETNDSNADHYLHYALKATDYIITRNDQGHLCDKYFPDGTIKDSFSYCILGKCVLPLLKMHRIKGNPNLLMAAEEILSYIILTFQDKEGRFRLPGQHVRNRVHYHCYAIEGLINYLRTRNDPKFYAAARLGAEFLLKYQKDNGGFWNRITEEENDGLEDVPPTAQSINIWKYFLEKEQLSDYQAAIDNAHRYLSKVQYKSISPYLHGGFPFMLPENKFIKKACSWACLFAIDTEVSE